MKKRAMQRFALWHKENWSPTLLWQLILPVALVLIMLWVNVIGFPFWEGYVPSFLWQQETVEEICRYVSVNRLDDRKSQAVFIGTESGEAYCWLYGLDLADKLNAGDVLVISYDAARSDKERRILALEVNGQSYMAWNEAAARADVQAAWFIGAAGLTVLLAASVYFLVMWRRYRAESIQT